MIQRQCRWLVASAIGVCASFGCMGISPVHAQSDTAIHEPRKYIASYPNDLTYKMMVNDYVDGFQVRTPTGTIALMPNVSTILKPSINFRFVTLSYSFAPKFFPGNNDDATKGSTGGFSFGFGFNFRHWFQTINAATTHGYYLTNTRDYNPLWKPGDPYVQFPQLRITQLEGSIGYSTNSRFSMSAFASQTERQTRSAGTFRPHLSYHIYRVEDQSGGVGTQASNNYEFMANAGYHHTFVTRGRWYVSGGSTVGAGVVLTRLTTRTASGDIITHSQSPAMRWELRAGLGYNGPILFAGASGFTAAAIFQQENTTAVNSQHRSGFEVFAGFRMIAPEFVRNLFNRIKP